MCPWVWGGAPRETLHALGAPTFEEVQQVAAWTHARMLACSAHTVARSTASATSREFTHDQAVLASCYAASAADAQLLGDTAGQRTLKLVQAVRAVPSSARSPRSEASTSTPRSRSTGATASASPRAAWMVSCVCSAPPENS